MLLPLVTLLLSQVGAPPLSAADVQSDVSALKQFVNSNMLTLDDPMTFRKGHRTWSLNDDDWPAALSLVPEAESLAVRVRDAMQLGRRLVVIGLSTELTGAALLIGLLVTTVGALINPVTIVVLALAAAGIGVVGAIVALVGLVPMVQAQVQLYQVIGMYNHGLAQGAVPSLRSFP